MPTPKKPQKVLFPPRKQAPSDSQSRPYLDPARLYRSACWDREFHHCRALGRPTISVGGALRDSRPIRFGHAGRDGVDLRLGHHRLFDQVCRLQHDARHAGLLPGHRTLGRSRRLAASVGMGPDYFFRHRRVALPRSPEGHNAMGDHDLLHRIGVFSRRRRFSLESL